MALKTLTKVRLINWHYFINETIDIRGNVLITGENGAGKSTILDAIQYVLTAGTGKFNTAANINTKRTIEGYVRCKIGTDTKTFLREDDVTAHIALEFRDETIQKTFLIGAVIDFNSAMSDEKVLFYTLEKEMTDDLFLQDNGVPRDIKNFKARIKDLPHQKEETKRAAKAMILHRLGQLDQKYVDLLTKALAFRPIDDVKDFVYHFVLDDKEVHIDHLRENVRHYRELEVLLEETRRSVEELKKILDTADRIQDQKHKQNRKAYIMLKGKVELAKRHVDETEQAIRKMTIELEGQRRALNRLVQEEEQLRQESETIRGALLRNESYQRRQKIKNEIRNLNIKRSSRQEDLHRVQRLMAVERKRFGFLVNHDDPMDGYQAILAALNENLESLDVVQFKNRLDEAITLLKKRSVEYTKQAHDVEREIDNITDQIRKVYATIEQLEKKKRPYKKELIRLRELIAEELNRLYGKDIPVYVFCELLEIKDERWRNAIEGYLNTQRFDLIVDPEYFDDALRVYERVKFKERIYGIGLVNVAKLRSYQETTPNSLASKVTSDSFYAMCYANMLLNRVHCCETVEELKHYPCAITPTCMVYQNHTARQINEKVYRTPYIGQRAIRLQLEENRKKRDTLKREKQALEQTLSEIENIKNYLSDNTLYELKGVIDRIDEYRQIVRQLEEKNQELSSLPKDETIIDLEQRLDRIKTLLEINRNHQDDSRKQQGKLETIIEQKKQQKDELLKQVQLAEREFLSFKAEHPEVESEAEEEFERSIQKERLEKVIENAKNRHDYYQRMIDRTEQNLKIAQNDYNINFQFGGALGYEGIDQYREQYERLINSELLKHEDEARELKEKTELEFKEHFIAKLQENIKEAQRELNQLNKALKDKAFGQDAYSFHYQANSKYKRYYDMIMDEDNMEGLNLFSEHFKNKHQVAMNELFDRIIIDDDFAEQAVKEFTDYRTYLDYDIKIHHPNGETSSFSKVNREKSGGETQTPFYVIMAASFVQLFNNANHSLRLVLFDEAFNNMDEGRIETMMAFYRTLNLQMIIAVPSQRIDTIQPYVDSTLVVLREGHQSFVTNFDIIGDRDADGS